MKDRFAEMALYERQGLDPLWNQVRDAVGLAVREFTDAMRGTNDLAFTQDCAAKGRYCLRVSRPQKSVWRELYLNLEDRTLDQCDGGDPRQICGFRASQNLEHLEFYSLDETFTPVPELPEDASEPDMALTADQVCEMALRDFLFDPPPRPFRIP